MIFFRIRDCRKILNFKWQVIPFSNSRRNKTIHMRTCSDLQNLKCKVIICNEGGCKTLKYFEDNQVLNLKEFHRMK